MRAICSPTASGAKGQAVDFWYLITCNQSRRAILAVNAPKKPSLAVMGAAKST
jgi:hypothetical protein